MPFGVVSGVGRGMGVLDGGDDRRRGKGSFAKCPIVINGAFATRLLSNYFEDLLCLWAGRTSLRDNRSVSLAAMVCNEHATQRVAYLLNTNFDLVTHYTGYILQPLRALRRRRLIARTYYATNSCGRKQEHYRL